MVKYTSAALAVLTTVLGVAVSTKSYAFVDLTVRNPKSRIQPHINSRRYSAIPYDEYAENEGGVGGLPSFPSTASLLDGIPKDNQAEIDVLLAKKEKRGRRRVRRSSIGDSS